MDNLYLVEVWVAYFVMINKWLSWTSVEDDENGYSSNVPILILQRRGSEGPCNSSTPCGSQAYDWILREVRRSRWRCLLWIETILTKLITHPMQGNWTSGNHGMGHGLQDELKLSWMICQWFTVTFAWLTYLGCVYGSNSECGCRENVAFLNYGRPGLF